MNPYWQIRQLDFTPKQEYQEADVEEELYDQMKDVSNDLDGELAKHVLPGQLSHQLAEGGKTKAVDNTVNLVKDVISSDALQSGLTTLLARVVGSNQFQNACQMLLKNLWDDLISDPETIAQVVALLNTAIKDEKIKSSFRQLILGLLQDEEVKRELTGLVVKLGEEKEVSKAHNIHDFVYLMVIDQISSNIFIFLRFLMLQETCWRKVPIEH